MIINVLLLFKNITNIIFVGLSIYLVAEILFMDASYEKAFHVIVYPFVILAILTIITSSIIKLLKKYYFLIENGSPTKNISERIDDVVPKYLNLHIIGIDGYNIIFRGNININKVLASNLTFDEIKDGLITAFTFSHIMNTEKYCAFFDNTTIKKENRN